MKPETVVLCLSWCLLLAGTLCELFGEFAYSPYLFAVGAAGCIALALTQVLRHRDAEKRHQRLYRIQLLASLCLALGAYLMFTDSRSWIPMALIYALIELFLTFRFPNGD